MKQFRLPDCEPPPKLQDNRTPKSPLSSLIKGLRSRIARRSTHESTHNLREDASSALHMRDKEPPKQSLAVDGSLISLDNQQSLKYEEIEGDKKRPHVQIHNHYNITINQQ